MALVKCPKCGQSVSSLSKKCVKCGYDLEEYEKAKLDFVEKFNDNLQQIVNLDKEQLLASANDAREIIMDYLYSIYDANTATEIFVTFVSMCFASDDRLSYDEYELLTAITAVDDFSYNDCLDLVEYTLNNDSDMVEEVVKKAPKEVKAAISSLCIVIAAIDGIITADEKLQCMHYFLLSCLSDKEK